MSRKRGCPVSGCGYPAVPLIRRSPLRKTPQRRRKARKRDFPLSAKRSKIHPAERPSRFPMHIVLLQHNPIPGDFHGNAHKLADMARKAVAAHPSAPGERTLCVTPAYALAGMPWEPLKHIGGFYRRCRDAAHELAELLADGPDMLISLTGAEVPLYVLLSHGNLIALARQSNGVIRIPGGPSFYLPETEPAWAHQEALGLLKSARGAASVDAVLFTSAELFLPETQEKREMHCSALAGLWKLPVISVHQCGAVDSLIYSGRSFVLDASCEVVARTSAFEEAALVIDLSKNAVSASAVALDGNAAPETVQNVPERAEALFRAATLGVRDYVRKCGMSGVVLGLSGGMDSALVACIAVEALGAENVLAVLMPSRWSTDHSESDADVLAKNLGIQTANARITPIMDAFFPRSLQTCPPWKTTSRQTIFSPASAALCSWPLPTVWDAPFSARATNPKTPRATAPSTATPWALLNP